MALAITGRVFGIHGQQIFEYKMEMTPGVTKAVTLSDPQENRAKIEQIGASKAAAVPAAGAASPKIGVSSSCSRRRSSARRRLLEGRHPLRDRGRPGPDHRVQDGKAQVFRASSRRPPACQDRRRKPSMAC